MLLYPHEKRKEVMSELSRAKKQLLQAINVMRRFLNEAEESINNDAISDSRCASKVITSLSWGMANSSSSIESALTIIDQKG